MICPYCNSQNKDGAVFCGYCGNRILPQEAEEKPQEAGYPQQNSGYAPQNQGYPPQNAGYMPPYQYDDRVNVQQTPAPKATPRRWNPVIGILLLVALTCRVILIAVFSKNYGIGLRAFSWVFYVELLMILATAILFLTPTRNCPIVTIIPSLIYLSCNIANTVYTAIRSTYSISPVEITAMLIACSAITLYFLASLIRPHSKALAIVHLVLSVHVVLLYLVENHNWIESLFSSYVIDSIYLWSIILGASFIIAGFCIAAFQIYPKIRKSGE